MTLTDYLARQGITAAAFARLIDAHPATVGRYCTGQRTPRPAMALRIRAATAGAVTANDFLDLAAHPRLKAPAPPSGPGSPRQAAAA